jgi:chromosome segregation protein
VSELDLARAAAEGNLAHLEETCHDTLQLSLDDVTRQLAELQEDGGFDPDAELQSLPSTATGTDAPVDADEDDPDDEETAVSSAGSDDDGAEEMAEPVEAVPASSGPMTVDAMVAVLRAKIERLGPVNMMAIEEFDDLDERYDFLTTQRRDLEESIKATGDAISRMNRTTRERFREAFDAINTHFQTTFSTLFGGGRAGLVLLDETDLLESGIDIIAQPPGKRLQSIQLLSGGEKAMTAMALMFAIFKYKPSPFCLLDEIDAPLDEANIGRFVEMLRAMQSDTQFILVTHNRKTMEIADRLYGVTMEEPGVSKLISVQLA